MKQMMPVLACAVLVVGLAACAPPPAAPAMNAPEDLAAIDVVRSSFVASFNAGDAAAIGALWTDDGVSQPNHAPTATGREAIVAAQTANFGQMTFNVVVTPDETKTMGTWGFDRGRYTMTITPKAGGAPMKDEGRYLVLLQKGTDGKWRVSHDIDNSTLPMPMPPMPEPAAKGKGK
jgi:uncharacterized protein (TIGR02246 family)